MKRINLAKRLTQVLIGLASTFSLNAFSEQCPAGTKLVITPGKNTGGFKIPPMRRCVTDPSAAPAGCGLIYQHGDFTGAVISLADGQKIDDFSGRMISRRSYHGQLRGWSGRDVSWDNAVSSIKVKANCTLSLYDQAYLEGEVRHYAAIFTNSNAEHSGDFNDRTSSVSCKCGGQTPGGFFKVKFK